MESAETPAAALAGIERARGRLAGSVRTPVWRAVSNAAGTGAFLATYASGTFPAWAFLALAAMFVPSFAQLRDASRPRQRGLLTWAWPAAVIVVLLLPAFAAALWLGWNEREPGLGIALGAFIAIVLLALHLWWARLAARPVIPDASAAPLLDAVLEEPLALRLLGVLASYRGHLEAPTVEHALEAPDTAAGAACTPLVAAGYAEFTDPDQPFGRGRIWLRATPAGIAAFDSHLAALRASATPVP
ncbi:hypothetical protein [Demequina silvatica]|uniref:hypothetical protein n=1 Tax=Demequina silvatica TaxID=1638988 RepID=UPI0007808A20|nr:hypothetical protein [Demequina silvatica]